MPPGSTRTRGVIAHVLPWENIGGTELQTLRLAQAARELGFTNIAYVPAGAAKVRSLFEEDNFEAVEYNQVLPSFFRRPLPFLRNVRALSKSFKQHKVQIVHCADILAAYFTSFAARRAGAAAISHVRNHYPDLPKREKRYLRPVQQFIFVSKNTRENFSFERGREISRILYDVPGALYQPPRERGAARAKFGLPRRGHVFGMAARVSPQKDFETLIEAAQIVALHLEDCSFLIAGDHEIEAPHRDHYDKIVTMLEQTGTRDIFYFAGFQSEMNTFYSAIDTFVLSSNWEGLPTVVLEAMMYGIPVVCTHVGGIAEAVEDGTNGFVVPPKSPTVLAFRLIEVATDRSLVQRITEEASQTLTTTFGQERFLTQVDELYSSLLNRR